MERFKREVVESPCFDKLREKYGNDFDSFFFSRVKPVAGDLSLPNLGLSEEDTETITKNTKVFINCAASVDFVINVDTALMTNIYGTMRMLELAQKCPEPPNFVHISTAFVSSNRL